MRDTEEGWTERIQRKGGKGRMNLSDRQWGRLDGQRGENNWADRLREWTEAKGQKVGMDNKGGDEIQTRRMEIRDVEPHTVILLFVKYCKNTILVLFTEALKSQCIL